jgi:hypothetical protein
MLTEDEKKTIEDAGKKAYIDEKKKISKRNARRRAQWENKSFIEKLTSLFGGFFDD